ncbi:MAG: hypothetical protein U1E45_06480 [Geminicoccaceae bacterium]
MTSEEGLEARLVDETVEGGESGVAITRRRPRPMLPAATSGGEALSDLPELVCRVCEASFGKSSKSYAGMAGGVCTGACRCGS